MMPLAGKVSADRFIKEIKKAPRGAVWMSEHHVLVLRVLDHEKETIFEAPDPLDMSDTEWRAFYAEVLHWIAVDGIRQKVSYYS